MPEPAFEDASNLPSENPLPDVPDIPDFAPLSSINSAAELTDVPEQNLDDTDPLFDELDLPSVPSTLSPSRPGSQPTKTPVNSVNTDGDLSLPDVLHYTEKSLS